MELRTGRLVLRPWTELSKDETYAVCLKDETLMGCISLKFSSISNIDIPDTEAEIGCWIGVEHWDRGYCTEACGEMIRHAFEGLRFIRLWGAVLQVMRDPCVCTREMWIQALLHQCGPLLGADGRISYGVIGCLERKDWSQASFLKRCRNNDDKVEDFDE